MALANFFDKASLAASQILQQYDHEHFAKTLLASPIELAFDKNAVNTSEGRATIDLAVRLLARLYPKLVITAIDATAAGAQDRFKELAKEINPLVGIVEDLPVCSLIVGSTSIHREAPSFYVGSNGWNVAFSDTSPVRSGDSDISFAAGAAACFGAANIFRVVFGQQLSHSTPDKNFRLSLIDYSRLDSNIDHNLTHDIGTSILVGLGAIGNGVLWALANSKNLSGSIIAIDSEEVDISNLQRYVMTTQSSVGNQKCDLAATILHGTKIGVTAHYGTWANYLSGLSDWRMPTVIAAVDNAADRIAIQSSLPQEVLNGWTDPSELGISRHLDFNNEACLACLYPPKQGTKPESVMIAEALGLPQLEIQIRELIYNNSPITTDMLNMIATARNVSVDILTPFCNLPIRDFYSKVICGGIVLTNEKNQRVETPMAFQSALAGILLASELVILKSKLRPSKIAVSTRINLLRQLPEHLNDPILKMATCLCQDGDFLEQYNIKYN